MHTYIYIHTYMCIHTCTMHAHRNANLHTCTRMQSGITGTASRHIRLMMTAGSTFSPFSLARGPKTQIQNITPSPTYDLQYRKPVYPTVGHFGPLGSGKEAFWVRSLWLCAPDDMRFLTDSLSLALPHFLTARYPYLWLHQDPT